ncbi:diacylglycerol kinase [Altererythrobacter indicus]|uniref:Diacylglycerol kinase n=1 Tax=Altericroceibacterium indicum TaxID=374177 RepID=A0A845A9T1_9SPHN|nr:diacylglycerol kinase family protein [Altericroceibacterium indicum]MXP26444.1 diacylglycerol kinase [Altericroceibacterium indicum]
MNQTNAIWVVTNAASGSNDDCAVEMMQNCCGKAGFTITRHICFPDDDLPKVEELREAGIETVVVFAGDGTTNALITALYGWEGAILVLPGGTMNILYHRLHGDTEMADVLERAAKGDMQKVRPGIVRCSQGDALAGLLAGPATAWNDVREAMRHIDIRGMAEGAADALDKSLNAPTVTCAEPQLGRAAGYPLIMLTPTNDGIQLSGYRAENIGDYVTQGFALLRRNFRAGPHDDLGLVTRLQLRNLSGEPLEMLLDGEPAEAESAETEFLLVLCEVDLLATLSE